MADWNKVGEKLVNWLRKEVKDANGVVLGMSGGLDSSTVAVLCKKAFPQKSLALIMPCGGNPQDEEDAIEFAKKIGIKYKKVDLKNVYNEMLKTIGEDGSRIAEGNLKARLRMCTLYFFANKMNYLVAGSGNKSELMLGYFTKYGDGAADLLPLGGMLKKEVKELAKALNVPTKIQEKAPSAGLWKGQTDEAELGMSYTEIDSALEKISQGKEEEINQQLLEKIKKRISANKHKRALPRIFSLDFSRLLLH